MFNKKVFSILMSFSIFFMVSCYNDDKGSILPFLGGKTVTTDDTATGETDTGSTGTETSQEGDDTGGTTVPAKQLSTDDVKTVLNKILQEIDAGTLLESLKDGCTDGTKRLVDKDTIKVDALVTCSPFSVLLTITLNQYIVEEIDCAKSGVMTVKVQFPTNMLGTYLLTINTAEGSPITVQGEDCGNSTLAISNLSMCVTMVPFSSLFKGTVVIGSDVHEIAEFATPADILEILKGAFDKFPWDEILGWFDTSGGSTASSQSVYGTTYTVYNESGLKVGLGLSKDWEIIIEVTFTSYKFSDTSSTALNGTLIVLASIDSTTVLKLVCNTESGSPLTISGIPLITPKIALTDVTIYYDWYNEAIVDNGGSSGTISLNGIKFSFDPEWISTILGMLE